MDITTIDAISFATRVGQAAASELYGLLADQALPPPNWFHPGRAIETDYDAWLDAVAGEVAALGQYVCANQVEQGERLFRWAGGKGIVPLTEWSQLDFAGKQAFEAFVHTARQTYLGIAVAQKAMEEARRQAGVVPPPLKREDSIFEFEEPMGKLRDEAIAAAPLQERYRRESEDAARLAAAEKAAQDKAEAEATAQAAAAEQRKAKRARPEPVSAGEALAGAPKPNRGGRGKRNPT